MGEPHTQNFIELLIEKCCCTAKAIGASAPLCSEPGYSPLTCCTIAETPLSMFQLKLQHRQITRSADGANI